MCLSGRLVTLLALTLTLCHATSGREAGLRLFRHRDPDVTFSIPSYTGFRSNDLAQLPRAEASSVVPAREISFPLYPLPALPTEDFRVDSSTPNVSSSVELATNSTEASTELGLSSAASSEFSSSEDWASSFEDNSTEAHHAFGSSEMPETSAEIEEVVLGARPTPGTVPLPKSLYQKTIEWMEDAYTVSILLPIAAGVVFATAIIMTIACCRCMRRCCRRRRYRKKVLPDTVKNMRPSDRARLLAETSEDEF